MKKEMVSWDTPPKEGEKFMIRTDKFRMIIMNSISEFEEKKEDLLRGEEIAGWLPVSVDNKAPPFLTQPSVPMLLETK